MSLQDLMSLLSKYGLRGGLFTAFGFIVYALLKTQRFSDFVGKQSDKVIEFFMRRKSSSRKINITESDIINHDIFSYIDFWMYSKVPTFQFSTEYRNIIFRRYLTIYLKKYKEDLSKYVTSKKYEEMDSSELWKSFLSLVNDTVYDYEREMELSGIPKIIIEKMKMKNNDSISLTIDIIEGICNSQFYQSDNNLLKVYSILNIMVSILENTVTNSESICNSINGQLKGLTTTSNGKVVKEP